MNHSYVHIESSAEIPVTEDLFRRIVGQNPAIEIVRSAVIQHRHVLLCGVPGVGKSMIAKAAASLLPPPTQKIGLRVNPQSVNRPLASVEPLEPYQPKSPEVIDTRYVKPESLPFDVAIEMGYRCPRCGNLSVPHLSECMECGSQKRSAVVDTGAYYGLFKRLDVVFEPALSRVIRDNLVFERDSDDAICVTQYQQEEYSYREESEEEIILLGVDSPRFIRVSGASATELLGDVKHDPYGSATELGTPPHRRVVLGAIHEAHEGILYIDEIATLGAYQKHLLTAMQDRRYSISGQNPQSSGASVRVDDVPCDFILIASCNIEDLSLILPPLRSRIRGYGYEVMLSSWMMKSSENADEILRFVAQTIIEDGRIPHFSPAALGEILHSAEKIAYDMDRQRDAFTLRLRELGGIVRIAGDLAVNDAAPLVEQQHVKRATSLSQGIDGIHPTSFFEEQDRKTCEFYGDYFF